MRDSLEFSLLILTGMLVGAWALLVLATVGWSVAMIVNAIMGGENADAWVVLKHLTVAVFVATPIAALALHATDRFLKD